MAILRLIAARGELVADFDNYTGQKVILHIRFGKATFGNGALGGFYANANDQIGRSNVMLPPATAFRIARKRACEPRQQEQHPFFWR
ncbi:hypothetical protein AAFO92_18710 [Roseovarius sp. CAU 1744]|uniref:hypothetical protein n=1 Tax=Roseovarius sp. CAU 1744 TaxID=3140368 RepID=UPI00325B2F19